MENEIRVFAPATVSNIGCGFDILGFAVDQPGDEIILRKAELPGVKIKKITGDQGKLPYDAELNTAGLPLINMMKKYHFEKGFELEIHKKMPMNSGLGSSAASAVAAVFACNELMQLNLAKNELLDFALEGERISSGSIHADNVAPCLFGGFVLIKSYDPVEVVQIPFPENLFCTVIHPRIEIKTKEARAMMPENIPLKNAITQWGNVAGLIAGLFKNDLKLICDSIKDVVAEPVRAKLIPRYYDIKNAAFDGGAIACNISGSGPSIFALSDSEESAVKISEAMRNVLKEENLANEIYISKINPNGPIII